MSETLSQMAIRVCRGRGCDGCPLDNGRGSEQKLCCILENVADLEEQIKALRDWALVNPPKTYKDDFFEKFPNAKRTFDGYPNVLFGDVHNVSLFKLREFSETSIRENGVWDKPLSYWEG